MVCVIPWATVAPFFNIFISRCDKGSDKGLGRMKAMFSLLHCGFFLWYWSLEGNHKCFQGPNDSQKYSWKPSCTIRIIIWQGFLDYHMSLWALLAHSDYGEIWGAGWGERGGGKELDVYFLQVIAYGVICYRVGFLGFLPLNQRVWRNFEIIWNCK